MLIDATSGAGGLPVDVRETDVYYFAPQKCFASDGGHVAGRHVAGRPRPGGGDRRRRPLGAGVPLAADGDQQLSAGPDLQHPGARDPGPAGRTRSSGCNEHGGLDWTVKRTADSASRLYGWAERTTYTSPYVADPAARSQVVGTIDFDESVDALAVAKVLRGNGIVDTEPYRKLGRNQLRIAMFPAIDPDDVEALTGCIDYIVERSG